MTREFVTDMMPCMARGRPRQSAHEPTIIGINLERLREKHRLTQPDLAARAGVSQPDVSRIERGETREPSANLLKKLADAMGESVAEFWVDPNSPSDKDAQQTLEEFLSSPMASDVTREEEARLRQARWPFGVPTARGWYHALELMRASRGRGKDAR